MIHKIVNASLKLANYISAVEQANERKPTLVFMVEFCKTLWMIILYGGLGVSLQEQYGFEIALYRLFYCVIIKLVITYM